MECLKIPFLCNSLRIFNEPSLPNNYFIISLINGNSKVLQVILNILGGAAFNFFDLSIPWPATGPCTAHSAVLHACKHVRVKGANPLILDNFECLKISCLLNFDPVGLSLAKRQCINRIFFTRTPRQLCDLSLYTAREITILQQNAKIKMENHQYF